MRCFACCQAKGGRVPRFRREITQASDSDEFVAVVNCREFPVQ